jgi:hypothetical protein
VANPVCFAPRISLLMVTAALLALAPSVGHAQDDVPPVIAKFKAKDPGM